MTHSLVLCFLGRMFVTVLFAAAALVLVLHGGVILHGVGLYMNTMCIFHTSTTTISMQQHQHASPIHTLCRLCFLSLLLSCLESLSPRYSVFDLPVSLSPSTGCGEVSTVSSPTRGLAASVLLGLSSLLLRLCEPCLCHASTACLCGVWCVWCVVGMVCGGYGVCGCCMQVGR